MLAQSGCFNPHALTGALSLIVDGFRLTVRSRRSRWKASHATTADGVDYDFLNTSAHFSCAACYGDRRPQHQA